MSENENVSRRVEELISELSSCREDEQNAQNQILQVISTAGAVLGILVGISYLGQANTDIVYARGLFILSLFIFCAAFAYIIVLGINNILRYYYIQNLEDRLFSLVGISPDNHYRGAFLHWGTYSAPIITRNTKKINSFHTALNYFCYTVAACGVISFSVGMVILLFLGIDSPQWYDYLLVVVVGSAMVGTIVLFLVLCARADKVAQYAVDKGHDNQKDRLGIERKQNEGNQNKLQRILSYFFYPKKQDPQKPFLIFLGYLIGAIIMGQNIWQKIPQLILVIVVFDFLAYQARYQINDIRGIEEDREAGDTKRLPLDAFGSEKDGIIASVVIATIKIVLAVAMTLVWGGEVKTLLLISLVIVLVSTIVYELVRKFEITWLIYLSVGIGYPLRFCLGFFLMMPKAVELDLIWQLILFVIAFWTYGTFSSILSWTNQVVSLMQKSKKITGNVPAKYKKKYFQDIQEGIIERYEKAEKYKINQIVMPLRERCKVSDACNIYGCISLAATFFIVTPWKLNVMLFFLEVLVLAGFLVSIWTRHKRKLIGYVLSGASIVSKALLGIIIFKMPIWYLMLSMIQMLIIGTYFVLCYQPQVKKIDYKEMFIKIGLAVAKSILGKYAFETVLQKESDIEE